MSDIEKRKVQHIEIVMSGDRARSLTGTGLSCVRFQHNALPEMSLDDVDLTATFLGRGARAPIMVSSMTGGPRDAETINRTIAEACEHLGLPFGIGSQRIALEGKGAGGLGTNLRRIAPNATILANFGAAQLNTWDGPVMAQRAVGMIEADALIIHLNPLQEAVQPGGDTNWRDLLPKIAAVCKSAEFPIVVKEVGSGISGTLARRLVDAGVSAIDVAGLGGTSWAAVEAGRAETPEQRAIAETFTDWGIPTALAIRQVHEACPQVPLIASGGIENGLDCARALRLGATMSGIAAGVLPAALKGTEELVAHLETIIQQLRITCFCTGSRTLAELRNAPLITTRITD